MKIRTLIVDDEPLAREWVRNGLQEEPDVEIIGECGDGFEAVQAITEKKPQLVLLDVQMPGLDGFGVLEALEGRTGKKPAVVFVTAFDRYAVAAFDVAAVDYLLKPVSPERLARALARVREWRAADHGNQRKSQWITEFWVQNRGEMLRIDAGQVDLIEAERDYMRLHVGARSWLIHQTIKSLEARMDPDRFIRIHRSKMVRRDGIAGLRHHGDGAWSVDLGDGGVHRIGRTYLHDVKAIMQG